MVPRSPDAIEPDRAAATFTEFAADEELALRFPADGCYARTHLMVQRLLDRGLTPLKVWAFAAGVMDLLWTETPDHPDGRVQWGYHVAPVLVVRGPDGDTREMVFDPLLFDRPVVEEDRGQTLLPAEITTRPVEPTTKAGVFGAAPVKEQEIKIDVDSVFAKLKELKTAQ